MYVYFYSQAIKTSEKTSAALMESMLVNGVEASLLAEVAVLPEAVDVAWLTSLTAVGLAVAAPVLLAWVQSLALSSSIRSGSMEAKREAGPR